MEAFTETVIRVIRNIPKGNVMTYGEIARVAGSPRGARQVVRILHTLSDKYDLPWHRVVNRKGEIALKTEEASTLQKNLLIKEGISFNKNGTINLAKYHYMVMEE